MSVILPNKIINGYLSNAGTGNSVARWKNIREITDSLNVFISDSGELSIGKDVPESDTMLSLTQRLSNIDILKINDYSGSGGNLLSITKDGKFGFKIDDPLDEFHVNSDSRFTGKLNVGYSTFEQIGNSLNLSQIYACTVTALTSTRIAVFDIYNDTLRTYGWDGSDWILVGNQFSISGTNYGALAALNSTDVAFVDAGNDELRTYRFDGTDWSKIGNSLLLSSIAFPSLAALNSTDAVLAVDGADTITTYRFDGTDWSKIGNSLSITQIHTCSITALTNNTIAFSDTYNKKLRTYSFDGTDWSFIGNQLHIGNNYVSLAALNFTDIALIDNNNNEFRIYRWNGVDWAQFGIGLSISGIGVPSICKLTSTDIVFLCDSLDSLRTYRFCSTVSLIADDNRVGIGIIPSDDSLDIRGTLGDNLLKISSSTGGLLLRLLETGNFGIGEFDPETKVEITSSDPFITLHCNTETDAADSGAIKILAKREQSGGEETTCAAITAAHDGPANDEKGYVSIATNAGSDGNNPTERMRILSNGFFGFGTVEPHLPVVVTNTSIHASLKSNILGGFCIASGTPIGGTHNGGLHILHAGPTYSFDRPVVIGVRTKGTLNTPLIVENQDILFSIQAGGYDGSNIQYPSNIDFFVDGYPSNASVPSGISFVTGSAAGNKAERLTIRSYGYVGFGEHEPETPIELSNVSSYMTFHNITEEDSNGGRESKIIFKGEQSGGEETTLSLIEAGHYGTNDDQKGYIKLFVNTGTDGNNPSLVFEIDSNKNTKIGDGGITNYVNISSTGVSLYGTTQKWVPNNLRPSDIGLPSSNPPLRGEYQGFQFDRYDRSTEEQVFYIWHVPTDYAVGTASVRGHFGLLVENPPSGSGDEAAVIGFEYKKIIPGTDIFDFSSGTTSNVVTVPILDGESPYKLHSSPVEIFTTTGWAKGDIILFRFFRDATNVNDTYDNEAVAADNDVWIGIYNLEYLLDGVGGN